MTVFGWFGERGGYRRGKRLAPAVLSIAIGASPRFVNTNGLQTDDCSRVALIVMLNRAEARAQ